MNRYACSGNVSHEVPAELMASWTAACELGAVPFSSASSDQSHSMHGPSFEVYLLLRKTLVIKFDELFVFFHCPRRTGILR